MTLTLPWPLTLTSPWPLAHPGPPWPLDLDPHLVSEDDPLAPGPYLVPSPWPLDLDPHLVSEDDPLAPGPYLAPGPWPLDLDPHLVSEDEPTCRFLVTLLVTLLVCCSLAASGWRISIDTPTLGTPALSR